MLLHVFHLSFSPKSHARERTLNCCSRLSVPLEKGSTIITSNKNIREWPDMLVGDEVLATALLDRLLQHCNVVNIDGRSFRLRQIKENIQKAE